MAEHRGSEGNGMIETIPSVLLARLIFLGDPGEIDPSDGVVFFGTFG